MNLFLIGCGERNIKQSTVIGASIIYLKLLSRLIPNMSNGRVSLDIYLKDFKVNAARKDIISKTLNHPRFDNFKVLNKLYFLSTLLITTKHIRYICEVRAK